MRCLRKIIFVPRVFFLVLVYTLVGLTVDILLVLNYCSCKKCGCLETMLKSLTLTLTLTVDTIKTAYWEAFQNPALIVLTPDPSEWQQVLEKNSTQCVWKCLQCGCGPHSVVRGPMILWDQEQLGHIGFVSSSVQSYQDLRDVIEGITRRFPDSAITLSPELGQLGDPFRDDADEVDDSEHLPHRFPNFIDNRFANLWLMLPTLEEILRVHLGRSVDKSRICVLGGDQETGQHIGEGLQKKGAQVILMDERFPKAPLLQHPGGIVRTGDPRTVATCHGIVVLSDPTNFCDYSHMLQVWIDHTNPPCFSSELREHFKNKSMLLRVAVPNKAFYCSPPYQSAAWADILHSNLVAALVQVVPTLTNGNKATTPVASVEEFTERAKTMGIKATIQVPVTQSSGDAADPAAVGVEPARKKPNAAPALDFWDRLRRLPPIVESGLTPRSVGRASPAMTPGGFIRKMILKSRHPGLNTPTILEGHMALPGANVSGYQTPTRPLSELRPVHVPQGSLARIDDLQDAATPNTNGFSI